MANKSTSTMITELIQRDYNLSVDRLIEIRTALIEESRKVSKAIWDMRTKPQTGTVGKIVFGRFEICQTHNARYTTDLNQTIVQCINTRLSILEAA